MDVQTQTTRIGGIEFIAPRVCARSSFHTAEIVIRHDEYSIGPLLKADIATVIDLGGNIGAFGALMRRHWPGCRVLAWEPVVECAECYRINVPGAEVHAAAAWSECGTVMLGVVPETTVGSSVRRSSRNRDQFSQLRTVTAERVSSNIPPDWTSIDVLKLDVEGSEDVILQDLSEAGILPRIRYIRGEWHGTQTRDKCAAILQATHLMVFARGNGRISKFTGKLRT